jgi:glycine/D-amino acid oxidase-like deaminating enzyme
LYEECVKLGVKFIFKTRATSVEPAEDEQHFSSIQVQDDDNSAQNISCRSIVIAAGPWSPHVFSTLFPAATMNLPMNSIASAGNHFRVRTPGWKPQDDEKGSEQVFLQNDIAGGQGLDITSFSGGELYVGGWGAIPEELPELAESVKAQPSEIRNMVTLAKQYLNVDQEKELDFFDDGRCYRPFATHNHPIIMKVDWDLLGIGNSQAPNLQVQPPKAQLERKESHYSLTIGGLFLNTAHFSDGVTLSLGSGKVMSELLLGLPPSIDISGLGLQ